MKAKRVLSNIFSGGILIWLVLSAGCSKKTPTGGGGGTPTDHPTTITISGVPDTIAVGAVLNGTVKANDQDGLEKMTISASDGYSIDYSLNGNTATKNFTDTLKKAGEYTFDALVTDNNGNTTKKSASVYAKQQQNKNTPSTISFSPTSAQNNKEYTATITAQDPDGLKELIMDGYLNKKWDVSGTSAKETYTDSIHVSGALPQTKNIRLRAIDAKNDTTS
ncbi:MAG TPA: hypothetical protein VKA08_19855, partial [Balneolales bacterium]|nr:hypothetical protein [Balneolales bacterium]